MEGTAILKILFLMERWFKTLSDVFDDNVIDHEYLKLFLKTVNTVEH